MNPDPADKMRRRITAAAARGVGGGSDARRATFRAARRLARGWVPAEQLPSPLEVHGAAARSIAPGAAHGDRLARIAAIVGVLERVSPEPVGATRDDMLDQSLRVFGIVHAERPFDEELLTAALVHDVGQTLDRGEPVAAGLEALGDLVTPRTRWLVESLAAARAHRDGSLGHRARRRLESHPDFEAVELLADADRRGRVRGYDAPSLEEAIAILRALEDDDDTGGDDGDPREA